MKAVYPGEGDSDAVPGAAEGSVPGRRPAPEEDEGSSFTLEVDGELWELRPDPYAGTDYTWLTGPNPGYGFSLSPTRNVPLDQHRENIRAFLAEVDPATGYLREE